MGIVYVEYDDDGELFHVAEILTTEGPDVGPPAPDLTAAQRKAHEARVDQAIRSREAETRARLQQHVDAGKKLVVLAEGADRPEPGRHRVDPATKRVLRRTDAQLVAHREKQRQDNEARRAAQP